jgi:hypothetical protein
MNKKHIGCLLVLTIFATVSFALAENESSSFIRVYRNAGAPISMDTAITTYTNKDISVDLVAAVHVGEADYYSKLNEEFTKYDAVLYELIAPEDVDFDKREKGSAGNILTFLQTSLKSALGLEFQLDGIDYKKKNFVHADMTPDAFADSMEKRGESIWSMMIQIILHSKEFQSKNPGKSGEMMLLRMLLSPNRKYPLRTMLAEQFENLEPMMAALDGPNGSTIVTERNKVALKVLDQQIKLGKKKVAIFYGAAHMNDMEERLISKFNVQKSSEKWVVAWKLN